MEGWSLCLSEMNYLKTGYKTKGLIDLHIVTDEDIRHKTSFGVMIGNHTDGAKPIKVSKDERNELFFCFRPAWQT